MKIVVSNKNLKNISRIRGDLKSREKYLRLDRNERVSKFEKKFIDYIKKKISSHHLTTYPELESVYLNLAKNLKVNKDNIVVTGGADLAIKNCFEIFVKPNNKIITLTPGFAMIDIYSKLFQTRNIKIQFDKNLNLNMEKLMNNIKRNIKMILLSNPNNPTGTIISKKNMIKIIIKAKKFNIPVVVDEVYFGFSNVTLINEIKKHKNLIIIRTFSKTSGLAGLRAGYIVADAPIAQILYKFKPMYEINSITGLAVNYVLKNNRLNKEHLKEVLDGKKYLIQNLKKLKINFIDTSANFIHIKISKRMYMKKIIKYFNEKKILTKAGGPGVKGFEDFIRVTTGSKEYMKKFLNYLKQREVYFN